MDNVISLDDELINELAINWYFLSLHLNSHDLNTADVDELIDSGITLKGILAKGNYTFIAPMNICVDDAFFFDIWLDEDGTIQASDLNSDYQA